MSVDRVLADVLAARWAAVMDCYVPHRATTMRHVVELLGQLGVTDHVVDLAGGTGAVSEAVRRVDPAARVTLVDHDPVMLEVARSRLMPAVQVLDRDVTAEVWVDDVGVGEVGAVVAASALHMVGAAGYRAVAERVTRALRPGGVLVDWDEMPLPGTVGAAVARLRAAEVRAALDLLGEDVPGWYAAVERLPGGPKLVAERHRRFTGRREGVTLTAHQRGLLLRRAGFAQVVEVARDRDVAVVVALR